MSKEKLYGLRDQLSKFLYDPTPEQAAERTKQWEEGRFEESMETTKQVEEQLEYVEKQIEAVEAAEPEIGEKIVTNTLLNMPWGRVGKFPGLGSLLGIAEEELQMDRLLEIEEELSKFDQLESVSQLYEDLTQEKKGIMTLLGRTPTQKEIERLVFEIPPVEEKSKALSNIVPPTPLNPEEEFQLVHRPVVSEGFALRNPNLVLDKAEEAYTMEDFERWKESHGHRFRGKRLLEEYRDKLDRIENPSRFNTLKPTPRQAGTIESTYQAELQKLSSEDAEELKEVIKRELNTELANKYKARLTNPLTDAEDTFSKEMDEAHVKIGYEPILDLLNKKIKGYKSGGYVMNYGDYGRSYN